MLLALSSCGRAEADLDDFGFIKALHISANVWSALSQNIQYFSPTYLTRFPQAEILEINSLLLGL